MRTISIKTMANTSHTSKYRGKIRKAVIPIRSLSAKGSKVEPHSEISCLVLASAPSNASVKAETAKSKVPHKYSLSKNKAAIKGIVKNLKTVIWFGVTFLGSSL